MKHQMDDYTNYKNEKEAAPDIQELAWYCWLGLTVPLFNISSFAKQQHPTRPVCEGDGSRQKQVHSILMSEQNMNLV